MNTPSDRDIATATQQLLKGVQLTGADVPAFVAIHNWLEAIISGQLVVVELAPSDIGMSLPRAVDDAPDVAPYNPANPEYPAPTQRAPGDV